MPLPLMSVCFFSRKAVKRRDAARRETRQQRGRREPQRRSFLFLFHLYDHTFPLRSKAPKGMKPKYL